MIVRAAFARDAHLAWMNATYAAWAFHDPQNMPADPAKPKKKSAQQIEADIITVRNTLIGWANRSGNG